MSADVIYDLTDVTENEARFDLFDLLNTVKQEWPDKTLAMVSRAREACVKREIEGEYLEPRMTSGYKCCLIGNLLVGGGFPVDGGKFGVLYEVYETYLRDEGDDLRPIERAVRGITPRGDEPYGGNKDSHAGRLTLSDGESAIVLDFITEVMDTWLAENGYTEV